MMLLLLIFSMRSFGQRYNFEQYDVQDGLVQSQITSITQDKQNRLWIATLGGLSRFNGNEFTNLSKTDGLNSNFVLSCAFNKDGSLFIGTQKGLSIYKNESLYNYPDIKVLTEDLTLSFSGEIYGLSGEKLIKINGKKAEPVYITGDTTEIVTALKTDAKGKTWAAVYKNGLYYLRGNKWYKKALSKQVDQLIINNFLVETF